MRTALFLTVAAAWFTVAAPAAAADRQQTFRHDGYTYVYSTQPTANGGKVITGQRLPDRETFRLTVNGNRVTGTTGDAPVAFDIEQAKGASSGMIPISR